MQLVKAWLERKDRDPWLMVIDNADSTEMFFNCGEAGLQRSEGDHSLRREETLGRYIPECSHGSILLTTRNRQAGVKFTKGGTVIKVRKMTRAESSQLICETLNEDPGSDLMALLTDRLENIPLALVQAAAFMHENSLTVIKYLQLLDQSDENLIELLSEPFETAGRDSGIPNAVTATWMVSFEQIRTRHPYASDLFSLMGFLDRQEIPKAALLWISEHKPSQGSSQLEQISQAQRLLQLEKALGILKAFSFVSEGRADESVDMHRLVQLVMQKWLEKEKKSKEWVSNALLTVSGIYPYGSYENWKTCGDYLPHALAVLNYEGLASTEEAVAKACLLHNTAGFMLGQGKWNRAEDLQLLAVGTRKRVLGEEHPDTLSSMANLASTYRNQGRWKEAEELDVQVMETSSRVLGEEHPDTLSSMANLASTYRNQGRWKEAEELDVQVMETSSRVLGEEHPDTLSSMANLAHTLYAQNHKDTALKLMTNVVKCRTEKIGADHPDTADSGRTLSIWNK